MTNLSGENLQGKKFIITGANGGLGEYVTTKLATQGATVVMACRNTATAQIIADKLGPQVSVAALDLNSLASVHEFASTQSEFDVLINNAGIMNVPFRHTADGFESQMGVNHLAHFALTGLLLPKISDRVIALASIAHKRVRKLAVNDLNYEHRRYTRNGAYSESKLANLMFARELQRRFEANGDTRRGYAVHPGVSPTALFAHTETFLDKISSPFVSLVGHPPAKAAESLLLAATADVDPHTYWGPTGFMQMSGKAGACPSTSVSKDPKTLAALWEKSEELTGVAYL